MAVIVPCSGHLCANYMYYIRTDQKYALTTTGILPYSTTVTSQNFVKISQDVEEISQLFFNFQDGGHLPSVIFVCFSEPLQ